VRFVDNHQVPRLARQQIPHLLPPRQIHRDQHLRVALEKVGCVDTVQHIATQRHEVLAEPVVHLALPLVLQMCRHDEQDTTHHPARLQFLQRQSRHNRLAQARVICQQEAHTGHREDVLVHGVHLMGQQVNLGDADGIVGVEGVGKAQAERVDK
jgi:hypothetical protein